jgi:excisionase family DNA binding protein
VTIELDPLKKPTCTVDECAAVLGVARGSAYAAVKSGDLPTIRVGRRWLVPTAVLRRMLALDEPQSEVNAVAERAGQSQ